MAANTKTEFTLTHKKTTKGTYVYANEDAGFSGIYFSKDLPVFKDAGKDDPPKTIKMTLTL